MADRIKFGYMNYDEIADRIERGKLNIYDSVYTKDTEELIFIKPDGSYIRTKSRIDIYRSVADAETQLNQRSDTYIGQIVGIVEDEYITSYNVNYVGDRFVVRQIGGNGNVIVRTKEEWNAMPHLLSVKGCIYVYSNYRIIVDPITGKNKAIPSIKIGDGMSYLIDLPFATQAITEDDIARWNNHVGAYVDEENNNLVFYH